MEMSSKQTTHPSRRAPRQTLPNNPAYCQIEAVTVVHFLAVVITESLLVKIAKQVERLNADIRPLDTTLHKTPEIFESVSVNVSLRVSFRVIDHVVNVI